MWPRWAAKPNSPLDLSLSKQLNAAQLFLLAKSFLPKFKALIPPLMSVVHRSFGRGPSQSSLKSSSTYDWIPSKTLESRSPQ
ncbi:hypothetical protein O181_055964 [Austropuccinia psidii MF-1]|uniref:Uncharacterized protein n=1 Tax=Austropuccinia psidii MF-1 TaxID=1389203 RepID=A0A9Q3HV63_9BASI|nr:hypothetical protein [Austropuccinia psidii MF-1]